MKKKNGFTLVELLAVIALLGILVIMVLPNVLDRLQEAKKAKFLDEAKILYSEATNKYVEERTKNGEKIVSITNEGSNPENELSLESGKDLYYTIRLDSSGEVTAFKQHNSDYCIAGTGDFLDKYTVDDVQLMSEENDCVVQELMENEKITLDLYVKTKDKPVTTEHQPKTIYLRYKNGWFESDRKDAKSITSIEQTPIKKNYYFEGFNYTSEESVSTKVIDCAGNIVVDNKGDETTVFGSVTQTRVKAFASFTKKYYKVSYLGNGNDSGSMDQSIYYYGDNGNKLADNAFGKVGYVFLNWSTTNNGSGTVFSNGQALPYIDDDNENELSYYKFNTTSVCGGNDNVKILYARWKECTSGYYCPGDNKEYKCPSGYTSKTGSSKQTDCYIDVEDGKHIKYANDGTPTICQKNTYQTAHTVYYGNKSVCIACASHYESNEGASKCYATTYTITYVYGNGTSNKVVKYTVENANTIAFEKPSKTGYEFNGWYNGETKVVEANIVSSPANYTLTAKWTPITYTITYNANGGSGTTNNSTHTYDRSQSLTNNGFSRSGYTFDGWATSSGGSVSYSNKQEVSNLTSEKGKTITLYAHWKQNSSGGGGGGSTYTGGGGGCSSTQYCVYENGKLLGAYDSKDTAAMNAITKGSTNNVTITQGGTQVARADCSHPGSEYVYDSQPTSTSYVNYYRNGTGIYKTEVTRYQYLGTTDTIIKTNLNDGTTTTSSSSKNSSSGSSTTTTTTKTSTTTTKTTTTTATKSSSTSTKTTTTKSSSTSTSKSSSGSSSKSSGGSTSSGGSSSKTCLAKGTKVLLSNGKYKNIEDIDYDDLMVVYNYEDGKFTSEYPIWIEKEHKTNEYQVTTFSDGTTLRTVGDHAVFSKTDNEFISVQGDIIGKEILKVKKTNNGYSFYNVTVENVEIVNEEIEYYHVVSTRYYNIVSDNVLTTDDNVVLSNLYGFDSDVKWTNLRNETLNQRYEYKDFSDILPEYMYEGLRVSEAKVLSSNISLNEFRSYLLNNQLNEEMVKLPETNRLGNNIWMVTTSEDKVNQLNKNKFKYEEGSNYLVKKPNNENFKYYINTSTNEIVYAGQTIKVNMPIYLEAVYERSK